MNGSPEPSQAVLHQPATAGGRPAWRTTNITPAERAGRSAVGAAAIVAGIVLLARAGSALAVVLEALLIAAGRTPQESADDYRWYRGSWSAIQAYKDGRTSDASILSPLKGAVRFLRKDLGR